MTRLKRLILAALLLAMLLGGCAGNTPGGRPAAESAGDRVHLMVTRHFGGETLHRSSVELEDGWTVYDLLLETVEVETAGGSGFISGINGIASTMQGAGGGSDWFYYVNGIMADVGAMDYVLAPGDSVWWDYRSWENSNGSSSAATAGWPHAFLKGYGGRSGSPVVLYAPGWEAEAGRLADQLGVHAGPLEGSEALLMDRQGPTLVLGSREALSAVGGLAELESQFMDYREGALVLSYASGKEVLEAAPGTGTIDAHSTGLGDANPLWLVSGNDEEGVGRAVALLLEEGELLEATASIAVDEEGVMPLPLNR